MSNYGYYKSEKHSHRRERKPSARRGVVLAVLDAIVFAITVLAAAVLFLALFSKWADPRTTVFFAFLGLFYPIIYLVNFCCALWWTVRWRKTVFISLAVLVLGAGNMKLFYRPDIRKQYSAGPATRNEFTVVSYNVMNFSGSTKGEKECVERIADWANDSGAQIVCFQEVYFSPGKDMDFLRSLMPQMNYTLFRNSIPSNTSEVGSGLAILSTYPILRSGKADVDSLQVCTLWSDIKLDRDTVRVFCNHLQSTAVDAEDQYTTLTPQILDDTLAREKLLGVARKMAVNYRRRAAQADALAAIIKRSPYPTVVCGDFNDTPMSYVYRRVRRSGLKDAFVSKGHGVETTYKGLFDMFRIDYVLYSDRLDVKAYRSEDVDMSDHKPLVVRFELPSDNYGF